MRIRTQLDGGCPAVEFLAERSDEVIHRWCPGVRTSEVNGRQIKRLFQLLALASAEEHLPGAEGPSRARRMR